MIAPPSPLVRFFDDWNDVQLANGTVVWTSPTGHVYTTEPEGAQWFAGLGDPTGEPTVKAVGPTLAKRCMKMPTRERPRHEDTRRRLNAERHTNRTRLEQQEQDHQAWLAAHDEPAPF